MLQGLEHAVPEDQVPNLFARLGVSPQQVAQVCRRNGIRELSFFGSILRDDFTADSDVDLLAEFDPEAAISLLDLSRIEREFADALGRRVDLVTKTGLSRWIRDEILREAVRGYQA